MLRGDARSLARLPIDHAVRPVSFRGGERAGEGVLERFVTERLVTYGERRNQPGAEATSGLSPYLHFGHVSSHEVLDAVAKSFDWAPEDVAPKSSGSRTGWWGMPEGAEAFLDQLVTWRELGFNRAWQESEPDRYDSLPGWARETLEDHADDPRPHLYTPEQFDAAETHDEVWNAAQRELVREGRMHNYLRMLWGKKILEWSPSPPEALETMIELNNRYALDGRDPNSTSGIFWVLGRYDRAWGPERPIFGKVRYMSTASTRRKLRLGPYLERFGPGPAAGAPAGSEAASRD